MASSSGRVRPVIQNNAASVALLAVPPTVEARPPTTGEGGWKRGRKQLHSPLPRSPTPGTAKPSPPCLPLSGYSGDSAANSSLSMLASLSLGAVAAQPHKSQFGAARPAPLIPSNYLKPAKGSCPRSPRGATAAEAAACRRLSALWSSFSAVFCGPRGPFPGRTWQSWDAAHLPGHTAESYDPELEIRHREDGRW